MPLVPWAWVGCGWFATAPPPAPEEPPPINLTAPNGAVVTVPDPERVVIVEAIRSLDWCVYCVAQVRAWQEAKPQVDEIDARLVVLSPDAPDVLARMVHKRGFTDLIVASATPDVFAKLGIPPDPNRPELPQGTTLVIDPTGKELVRVGDADFRVRADPGEVLAAVAEGRGLALASSNEVQPPDWDGAATLALVRTGEELALEAVIAEGFHLYGSNETTSLPVALTLDDGTRAEVPPGRRVERAGHVAWLLEGAVRIAVTAPADAPVAGYVTWQLCNDRVCSAPRSERFALDPEEGRIIRPNGG